MRSKATSIRRRGQRGRGSRRSGWKLPDPHPAAELGVRPLPPLVLQAGHSGEVGQAGRARSPSESALRSRRRRDPLRRQRRCCLTRVPNLDEHPRRGAGSCMDSLSARFVLLAAGPEFSPIRQLPASR